jgi:hypothetical protein
VAPTTPGPSPRRPLPSPRTGTTMSAVAVLTAASDSVRRSSPIPGCVRSRRPPTPRLCVSFSRVCALTLGRRIASGCAYGRHAWTTRSRTCTMLDGERLLAPTEAARQLDVSMRTIERLVASRPATPSNWRWLVGWSGARGQARDVPDGAFRRHMTAIVRSVVAAVAPSASRPDWQGARLTTCASCCVGLEAGPRPTRNSPSTGSARPVTVLRRTTGRLAMATVAHRFDLTWSPGTAAGDFQPRHLW